MNETRECGNCGGTGQTMYRHRDGGVCYQCKGSGAVKAIKRDKGREVVLLGALTSEQGIAVYADGDGNLPF